MPDDTNRRVAEQVIGWKFLDVTPASCAALGHVGSYGEGIHGPCWFCQKCRPIPDYLHDPAAVFGPGGVVEKMQERGYSLRLGVYADAVVAGGARRNQDSPFRQVGPVDFYPTSYIYDPNGEIVMFIPGQVRLNRIIAFMDDYKKKVNTQYADEADRGGASPIQEVT